MSFLAALLLQLAAPSAHAACTVTPVSPLAGATLTSAPTFQWTQVGCTSVTLLASPQPAMRSGWSVLTVASGNGGKSHTVSAGDWSALSTGSWASGMCWRLVGRVIGGAVTYGPTVCVDVYADADGDGYSEADGDCNDADATVNPGEVERCDGWTDDNCDGLVGEYDMDGDGWRGCDGDCDDTEYSVQPDPYWEVCNGIDDDCDGVIDDDNDGDGYAVCDDCLDNPGFDWINPGATEIPGNYQDDDCDGQIDESTYADPSSSPY